MKKNINIIQINGLRGILTVGFISACLGAGFGWFPGWICMKLWNYCSLYFEQIPSIGIVQGVLLWGIIAASYFILRKNPKIVFLKASEGLTDEELRSLFADIKKQAQNDSILQSMLKAHEAELRIKNLSESNIPKANIKNKNDEIKNFTK